MDTTTGSARAQAARRLHPQGGSPPESGLDRLADLAARLLDVPASQISLLSDVQLIAGSAGLVGATGTRSAVADSLCTVTAAAGGPLVVTDAAGDERVAHLPPVVSGTVGAYLGAPLTDVSGYTVGALCVFTPHPRTWSPADVATLEQLGAAVVAEMELAAITGEHRTSQVVLELALAAGRVGVFDVDLVAGVRHWDDRLLEIFGYTREQFDPRTRTVEERVHPEDQDRLAGVLQAAIASGGVFESEYRLLLPGGTARWVTSRGRALRDQDGRTARLVGTIQDTTALRAQQTRTAEVLESMAVGYLSMDADWRITYANAQAVLTLGRLHAELVGGIIWDLFPSTVGTDVEAGYRRAAETGQVVIFDAYYPGPLQAWYEVRATPEAGGLGLYFLDITARHQAEEARAAAAAHLSGLAELALGLLDAETVTDLVATIAERGLPALGADGGAVAVPDPADPSRLRSYVTASYGPGAQADYAHLPLATTLPVCEAARTGRRVLLPDLGASLAYSPQMDAVVASTGSLAWASLPLRAGGQFIGVLTAGWDQPQTFPPEQLELLEAFAAQCAQALQRQHARDTERAATEAARTSAAAERVSAAQQAGLVSIAHALGEAEDQDDVLAVVAARGAELLGASGSGLCLRDPDGQHVRSLVTDAYDPRVAGLVQVLPADFPLPAVHAAATGTAHFLGDHAETTALFPGSGAVDAAIGVEASASVPMRAHGHLLGCLSLSFSAPRRWSASDRDLVEAFAALTAQALERIAARDTERAATTQQAGLVAIAQALEEADTQADVLEVVTSRGMPLLGAQGAVLCLTDALTRSAASPPAGASDQPPALGPVRAVATSFFDDQVQQEVTELPWDFPLPMVDAATTGSAHFLPDRAAAVARFPDAGAIYAAASTEGSAAVPLRAGGRVIGSLSLAFDQPHHWRTSERELLEAFAALTAQSLDRIAAREAERAASAEVARFSETLQRSLLTAPPEPDHLQVAVRYSPAAAQAMVGGDWYDAFMTSAGTTSLVIGDVTGHDSRAAAAMGQYRNLLRGIGHAVGDPPAAVLSALDRAVHDLDVGAMATLVLAQVEQTPEHRAAGTRVLRWSNAGHLPPLLITPGGGVRFLPEDHHDDQDRDSDLLVGLDPGAARHDHARVLQPGDTVLLYTDGLVERRRAPLQAGLDWLAGAVGDLAHLPLEDLLDFLLEQVGGQVDDDVALLAIRAHPEDVPRPPEAGPPRDPVHAPTLTTGDVAA